VNGVSFSTFETLPSVSSKLAALSSGP